jgi:hypothetical protein
MIYFLHFLRCGERVGKEGSGVAARMSIDAGEHIRADEDSFEGKSVININASHRLIMRCICDVKILFLVHFIIVSIIVVVAIAVFQFEEKSVLGSKSLE